MAMAAAAKLPTCFASAAAFPVAEVPPAVLEAVTVARPVEAVAPLVAVATIVEPSTTVV